MSLKKAQAQAEIHTLIGEITRLVDIQFALRKQEDITPDTKQRLAEIETNLAAKKLRLEELEKIA